MQVYLSSWSIEQTMYKAGLSVIDLPAFVRRLGFEGLEFSDRQVWGWEDHRLEDFLEKSERAGCPLILDINSDLTHEDDVVWKREINHIKKMLGVASKLKAKRVRICLGGQSFSVQKIFSKFGGKTHGPGSSVAIKGTPKSMAPRLLLNRRALRIAHIFRENMPSHVTRFKAKVMRAVASLREIVPMAADYEIPLMIENHWGISGRPSNIIGIVKEIDSPWLGTCPDFGNFPRDVNRYEGLKVLATKAFHVHAKSFDFDKRGGERNIDYRRCLQILREAGYEGAMSAEYEGVGEDLRGCLRTLELIKSHW